MIKYRVLLFFMLLVSFASQVNAYPESWETFNPDKLDAARDATIGSTQQLLEEREGKIECIACHGEVDDEYDGVITTEEIIEKTMGSAEGCLEWQAVGMCVWMTCLVPPICTFDVSIKVKNFVPDLTIQAYDRANGEPWTDSQDINQISQGDADSSWVTTIISWIEDFDVEDVGIRGGVSTEGKIEYHSNLHYKLVDGYGNPATLVFNQFASSLMGLVCEGTTTPFYPYFISNLDSIAWRWDIPEMFYPQSWAGFVLFDLGTWSNNYGPIYPRHGFMTAQDPLKAAVLASYRAAHVLTRSGEPHLYFTIDESASAGYWPPGPLVESDSDTGKWQQLYPKTDTSCKSFPYGGNPSGSRRSSDGNYVWNFWRSFKCCSKEGQILIFHTG